MIDLAVILTPETLGGSTGEGRGYPDHILGLSYLKRAVLSARQGGISRVLVLHRRESSDGVALLLRDKGLAGEGIFLSPLSLERGGPLPAAFKEGEGGILIVAEGTVFDPRIIDEAVSEMPASGARAFRRGLALCREEALPALVEGLLLGKVPEGFLPDGNRGHREGAGEAPLPAGRFSVRVQDRQGHEEAERRLLESVRKETDGFVARHLNRPLSLYMSRHFIRLGLTPNQISVGNLVIGLAGAWITALGGYANILAGAFLFQLGSVLDGSDGEVAKLTYNCSARGSWIDTLCDEIACFAFFVALPLGLYRTYGDPTYLFLGMATMMSGALLYGLMIRYVRKTGGGGSMVQILEDFQESSRHPGAFGRINGAVSALSFVFRRDFFAFAIFILCLLGQAPVIVWILGILTTVSVLYMTWFSSQRLRRDGSGGR